MHEKFKSAVCVMHNVVSSDKHTILDIIRVNFTKKDFETSNPEIKQRVRR
jgi:hypothetical protein